MNLFGAKKANNDVISSSTVINTISQLREQIQTLNKRTLYIETKNKNLIEDIKKIAKTNKQKALILLDKKKRNEEEILKNEGITNLLETQISSLETSYINKQVAETLRQGNNIVKRAQKTINVDDIDELMLDINETNDTQKSISNIFSQNIPDIYDDDLLNELNDITNQESDKEELTNQITHNERSKDIYKFPTIPTNGIVLSVETDDAEEEALNELKKSLMC
tara:strand:- start:52 stop:720 length:669 start_codon:yes stop_codon:yes gene_type:complete